MCVSEWRNGQHFIGGLWIITASLEPRTSEMEGVRVGNKRVVNDSSTDVLRN